MSEIITAKNMDEALEKSGFEPKIISAESSDPETLEVGFRRFVPLDTYLDGRGVTDDYVSAIAARVMQGTIAFRGDEAFRTSIFFGSDEMQIHTLRAHGTYLGKDNLRSIYTATKKRIYKLAKECKTTEAKHEMLKSASTFETLTAVASCYERTFLFGFTDELINEDGKKEPVWVGGLILYDDPGLSEEGAKHMDTYAFLEHVNHLFTFYPQAPYDFHASIALETTAQYINSKQHAASDEA